MRIPEHHYNGGVVSNHKHNKLARVVCARSYLCCVTVSRILLKETAHECPQCEPNDLTCWRIGQEYVQKAPEQRSRDGAEKSKDGHLERRSDICVTDENDSQRRPNGIRKDDVVGGIDRCVRPCLVFVGVSVPGQEIRDTRDKLHNTMKIRIICSTHMANSEERLSYLQQWNNHEK
mgnify:CR=1 FL=1